MSYTKALVALLVCIGGIAALASQAQNQPALALASPVAAVAVEVVPVPVEGEVPDEGPCVPCDEPEEIPGWTYQGLIQIGNKWYHQYSNGTQAMLVPCEME